MSCLERSVADAAEAAPVLLLVGHRHGAVVVEPLRHQLQRQRVPHPRRLLHLGPLVLEPDLHLGVAQLQVVGEALAALLRQVAVLLELALQRTQLLVGERRPRPLVVCRRLLLPLHFARARP